METSYTFNNGPVVMDLCAQMMAKGVPFELKSNPYLSEYEFRVDNEAIEFEDGAILGKDIDGCLILWNADDRCPYNCGETPKKYGVENITVEEFRRIV